MRMWIPALGLVLAAPPDPRLEVAAFRHGEHDAHDDGAGLLLDAGQEARVIVDALEDQRDALPGGAPDDRFAGHGHEGGDGLERFFDRIMTPFLVGARGRLNRWILLAGILILIGLSMLLVVNKAVILKMLPFDNKSEFQVVLDMPEGTSLERTTRVLDEIGARHQQPAGLLAFCEAEIERISEFVRERELITLPDEPLGRRRHHRRPAARRPAHPLPRPSGRRATGAAASGGGDRTARELRSDRPARRRPFWPERPGQR